MAAATPDRTTSQGPDSARENLEASRQAYLKAPARDPDFAEAHRGLGLALAGLGSNKEAGKEFVRHLRLRPDAPDTQ
ncbi:MAG: tetratricopeptide repeat protein, partial [Thermoanaerobaculia bacterium]